MRLFIDLVDVSDGDKWTSGSRIMSFLSCYGIPSSANEVVDDILIWFIQILGPSFWNSVDQYYCGLATLRCANNEYSERLKCLMKLPGSSVDVMDFEGGYSRFHYSVLKGSHLWSRHLLTAGGNTHLVGFESDNSPAYETPASLALYRANTFIALRRTLKDTKVHLDDFLALELQQVPFQESAWTKDSLSALFSEELDTSILTRPPTDICTFCARIDIVMVQPSWMMAVEAIIRGQSSKDVRDIIGSSMSLGWRPQCVPSNILAAEREPYR